MTPIVIKGIRQGERERYYQALEKADRGFHEEFPTPSFESLGQRLDNGHFQPLEQLLYEGLKPRLDQMVAATLELKEP